MARWGCLARLRSRASVRPNTDASYYSVRSTRYRCPTP
jgi:hypothetical protein